MGSKISRLLPNGLQDNNGTTFGGGNYKTGGLGNAPDGVKRPKPYDDDDSRSDGNDFDGDYDEELDGGGRANKEAGDSNILDAIEDIQKKSREELTAEFERVARETTEFGNPLNNPCYDIGRKLVDCVRRHPDELMPCFSIMDAYRNCISHSYAEQIEFFLEKDIKSLFPPDQKETPKNQPEKDAKAPEGPKKKVKKPIHPPPMLESVDSKSSTIKPEEPSQKKENKSKIDDDDKGVPWYQWPPWR